MSTTLFRNGTIRTNVEPASATWLLVDGHTVTETGRGDETPSAERVVDLEGGALVPGFCDAHAHLPATGIYASGMDFRGVRRVDEILDAFRTQSSGGGPILFGGNFEDPLDRSMSRHDLDRAVGERPAMLTRADMHSCIVSSALLSELDLSDPEGVGKACEMIIGNGFVPGHAELALNLVRSDERLLARFKEPAR